MRGVCWTDNLNLATAFATCGCEVIVDKIHDDAGTGARLGYYLSDQPVHRNGKVWVEGMNEAEKPLQFDTAHWRNLLRNGMLESGDPENPLLDALRSLNGREMLLSWMKRGDRCRLVMHRKCVRMFYVDGQEPMAHCMGQVGFETWETTDLKMAAALAPCGVPVLTMHEEGPQTVFTLPRYGYAMGGPPEDAIALVQRFRDGSLAKVQPDHVLLWGYQTLRNRESMLRRVQDQQHLILLRKPKSSAWQRRHHSALVEEKAKGCAFDDGLRHVRNG